MTKYAIGIVVPIAWDINGKPTRLALSTHDEQEYVIDRRFGKGRKAASLFRQWIQVEGELTDQGHIIIRSYVLMAPDKSQNNIVAAGETGNLMTEAIQNKI